MAAIKTKRRLSERTARFSNHAARQEIELAYTENVVRGIVQAVGLPAAIDLEAKHNGVAFAIQDAASELVHDKSATQKEATAHLTSIKGHVDKLLELIAYRDDRLYDVWRQAMCRRYPERIIYSERDGDVVRSRMKQGDHRDIRSLRKIFAPLHVHTGVANIAVWSQVLALVERSLAREIESMKPASAGDNDPGRRYVGKLATLYGWLFGRKATVTNNRHDDQTEGKFVAFALAVDRHIPASIQANPLTPERIDTYLRPPRGSGKRRTRPSPKRKA